MPHRQLYLAAYDVREPTRLANALQLVREYATGGQKSVHEIFLTPAERHTLLANMSHLLNQVDRFLLLRLDPRADVQTLGNADMPEDPDFFYLG